MYFQDELELIEGLREVSDEQLRETQSLDWSDPMPAE